MNVHHTNYVLAPQQRIGNFQCVGMCGAEAASFAVLGLFFSTCNFITAAFGRGLLLVDDTQRKGPCDWVKDDSARTLGDGPTPTHVETNESGNAVKAILLKLEQLPRVALSHRLRRSHTHKHTHNVSSKGSKDVLLTTTKMASVACSCGDPESLLLLLSWY